MQLIIIGGFCVAVLFALRLGRWWWALLLGVDLFGAIFTTFVLQLRIGIGASLYLALSALVAVVVAISIRYIPWSQAHLRDVLPLVSLRISAIVLLVLWHALPWAYFIGWPIDPPLIALRAEAAAEHDPYCLVVTGEGPYGRDEPVTRWAQLDHPPVVNIAGLFDFVAGSFYAVLTVQRRDGLKLFNWSYAELSFVPMSSYWVGVYASGGDICKPRTDFLKTLS